MTRDNIYLYAGLCLGEHGYLTPALLQKFIIEHPSSESVVAYEDLADALDMLCRSRWIECYNPRELIYHRLVLQNDL